eukprot:2257805-Prymnesium_polylepis.1
MAQEIESKATKTSRKQLFPSEDAPTKKSTRRGTVAVGNQAATARGNINDRKRRGTVSQMFASSFFSSTEADDVSDDDVLLRRAEQTAARLQSEDNGDRSRRSSVVRPQ